MRKYQSSHDRAFLLACFLGLDEIVRITLSRGLDDRVKEDGALSAFGMSRPSTAEFLIGSQGDEKLREYVLYHLSDTLRPPRNADADMVRWLLDLFEPAKITEEVILNARELNAEIIGMLLDHNKDLRITDEMTRKCSWFCGAITAFVTREPDIEIRPDMLITVIKTYPFNAELCINLINRADPASITCGMISWMASIAGNPKREEEFMPILLLLLELAGPLDFADDATTMVFVYDRAGTVVKVLLDHNWPVTPALLRNAAFYGSPKAFPVMFEAVGGNRLVTSELLEAAVSNGSDGQEILEYLVSQSSEPLSDETWARLIGHCRTCETLRYLLDMKPNVRLPEFALLHIVGIARHADGSALTMLLNDERDLEITDAVVKKALQKMKYGEYVPQLLNRHGTELITTPMLIGAVSNWCYGDEMTRALLHRKVPIEVPTAKVINAVIANTHSRLQILRMLEAHFGPFKFTDKDIETAAWGSLQMINFGFDSKSITHATPSMLREAAFWGDLDGMKFLLQLEDAVVTRETLVAAAGNWRCGLEMLRLLWDQAPDIKPCVEMFIEAAHLFNRGLRTITFLLHRVDDVQLLQQVLEAAINSEDDLCDLVEALLESSLPVNLTSEMVAKARAHRDVNPGVWLVIKRYAGAIDTKAMTDEERLISH